MRLSGLVSIAVRVGPRGHGKGMGMSSDGGHAQTVHMRTPQEDAPKREVHVVQVGVGVAVLRDERLGYGRPLRRGDAHEPPAYEQQIQCPTGRHRAPPAPKRSCGQHHV
jgi:hypothetical protein